MLDPRVSIVVPFYNAASTLSETVQSLLSQTFENFEIVAVDDGSTDASVGVIQSFHDARIRLIRAEHQGLCHALNRGIVEARAPFIARCDADDVSSSQRIERQLARLEEHPEAIGIFAYSTSFGARNVWKNADRLTLSEGAVREWTPLKDAVMLASSMLMRAQPLRESGGFRQEYYPCDDWDLELRLAAAGKLLILCEPLVAYRFHSGACTYGLFPTLREKSRWTENSYFRRLEGLPELTFEQFRAATPNDFFTRLRHFRKDSAALHMRIAGQRYLDGKYLSGAYHLAASSLLHPPNLGRRIKRLIHRG